MPDDAAGSPPGSSEGAGRARRRWYAAGLAAALAAGGVAAALLSSGSASSTGRPASAALRRVPTNRVIGAGTVSLTLNGDRANVTLKTNDLDGDAPLVHAMHIHGGGKGECPPASAARLHNGHLAIDTNDGFNYYGPPVQALTTRGDTSGASILVFSRYPTGGAIRYSRTITLPPNVVRLIRENNAVIVVHGIDYDRSGIYSGVLDRSDLDKTLPATATAPALCGRLVGPQEVAQSDPDVGRHPILYTASLSKPAIDAAEFLCHVPERPGGALEADRRRTGRSVGTLGRTAA